jgi:hypothetical protein
MARAITYCLENMENKVASIVPTARRSQDMDTATNFPSMTQGLQNLQSNKKLLHVARTTRLEIQSTAA